MQTHCRKPQRGTSEGWRASAGSTAQMFRNRHSLLERWGVDRVMSA
jgi:hypothetical protein